MTDELSDSDVSELKAFLQVPTADFREIENGTDFLLALPQWRGFNAFRFYEALLEKRPELIAMACEIQWLCKTEPGEDESTVRVRPNYYNSLIEELKSEVETSQWLMIHMSLNAGVSVKNVGFLLALNCLLEKGHIQNDLVKLANIFDDIKECNLAKIVRDYGKIFSNMKNAEFLFEFQIELAKHDTNINEWEIILKKEISDESSCVKQVIHAECEELLEDIYVDPIIIKRTPESLADVIEYNEISILNKITINNNKSAFNAVDFNEEIITEKSKICCLMGNAGSGKTFVSKRTALMFSKNKLPNIQFCIYISWGDEKWQERKPPARKDERLLIDWLTIALPDKPTKFHFIEYLDRFDGEGLLLILDEMDECLSTKFPFKRTVLLKLLTRVFLKRSTIIFTTRLGKIDILPKDTFKIDNLYLVLGFSPENREKYFKKQFSDRSDSEMLIKLLSKHEGIFQLSMIPINASLFAYYLKGTFIDIKKADEPNIKILTNLFYELTNYLVKWHLQMVSLEEQIKCRNNERFEPYILHCLYAASITAFQGIVGGDFESMEGVLLTIRARLSMNEWSQFSTLPFSKCVQYNLL